MHRCLNVRPHAIRLCVFLNNFCYSSCAWCSNYTKAGITFRNTMFVVPLETNSGLRSPHLLATSTIDFPVGQPLPPPRLQLPSDGPAVLFAGAAHLHALSAHSSILALWWVLAIPTAACADTIVFPQRCNHVAAGTPPFPVVEVNTAWLRVCGFVRADIIGKTMKVIQGPQTEFDRVQRLMVCATHAY